MLFTWCRPVSEINTSEFLKAFDQWVERTQANAEDVFRALVLDIFSSIQIRTPVDTGRARGNWQVEFNGPQSATISNNLPYIERLENGWSQQAPAGMVRVTLSEFERKLAKAAKDHHL